MSGRNYGYQYDTSPRKLSPEYDEFVRRMPRKDKAKNVSNKKANNKVTNKRIDENKAKARSNAKAKIGIGLKVVFIFALLFASLLLGARNDEAFAEIQKLKQNVATIQKENDQIEINIQNSLNINKVEQAAKELLGMQKLTNKQIVYINLPKKDYVEHKTEEVIIEEETNSIKSFFDKLFKKK